MRFASLPRFLAVTSAVAVAVALSGCGGGVGDVTGTVTYKGKPLDGGQIQFQAAGKLAAADIGKDGTYSVAGIPAGTAKISVAYVDEKATEYFRALSAAGRGGKDGGKAPPPPPADKNGFNLIPQTYSDFNSSGLTFEVKKGPNTHNVELK